MVASGLAGGADAEMRRASTRATAARPGKSMSWAGATTAVRALMRSWALAERRIAFRARLAIRGTRPFGRQARAMRTMGLILVAIWVGIGAWLAWIYFVTPQKDLERIKADQGGTDALGFDIKRTGTKYISGRQIWLADPYDTVGGMGLCRIYQVTVHRAAGASETYSIAVVARLFGLQEVRRLAEPRAGE
jgi:hypothetical protein